MTSQIQQIKVNGGQEPTSENLYQVFGETSFPRLGSNREKLYSMLAKKNVPANIMKILGIDNKDKFSSLSEGEFNIILRALNDYSLLLIKYQSVDIPANWTKETLLRRLSLSAALLTTQGDKQFRLYGFDCPTPCCIPYQLFYTANTMTLCGQDSFPPAFPKQITSLTMDTFEQWPDTFPADQITKLTLNNCYKLKCDATKLQRLQHVILWRSGSTELPNIPSLKTLEAHHLSPYTMKSDEIFLKYPGLETLIIEGTRYTQTS